MLFQRKNKGAPLRFRADTHNAMVEAAEAHRRSRIPSGGSRVSSGPRMRFVITSATRVGQHWQWIYKGVRCLRTETRDSGSDRRINAELHGEHEYTLYNLVEDDNTDNNQGIQSGIDLAEVGIIGIEPVPLQTKIWADRSIGTDGTLVYEFSYLNAPIRDCDEPEAGTNQAYVGNDAYVSLGDLGPYRHAYGGGGDVSTRGGMRSGYSIIKLPTDGGDPDPPP